MNKEEKQLLKEKIEEKIKETQKKVAALEEATQPIAPENSIGRVSRMDTINNKSVSEAALRIAKKQLNSLKLAFSKVEETSFGNCSNCKKSIQPARLMFMPESTLCIRCGK